MLLSNQMAPKKASLGAGGKSHIQYVCMYVCLHACTYYICTMLVACGKKASVCRLISDSKLESPNLESCKNQQMFSYQSDAFSWYTHPPYSANSFQWYHCLTYWKIELKKDLAIIKKNIISEWVNWKKMSNKVW